MRVSTVTISIEEFEDLISCKRKLEKIKRLKDENMKTIKETNMHVEENFRKGNEERVKELLDKQDVINIVYLMHIVDVLKGD